MAQIAESLGEHTSASLESGTNIWFWSHMTRERWLIGSAPDVTLRDWKTHLNSRSLEGSENRVSVPNAVKYGDLQFRGVSKLLILWWTR